MSVLALVKSDVRRIHFVPLLYEYNNLSEGIMFYFFLQRKGLESQRSKDLA